MRMYIMRSKKVARSQLTKLWLHGNPVKNMEELKPLQRTYCEIDLPGCTEKAYTSW